MRLGELPDPLTVADALRIAREIASAPDTVVPYPHPGLENARYGRGFAFLETIPSENGETDCYVLVTTTKCGTGVLSAVGRTIESVIAEHLAEAEYHNREIADDELSFAHRIALLAYESGQERISGLPALAGVDAATLDYAEYLLLRFRAYRSAERDGRKILAREDHLLRDAVPGTRYTQPCPHCGRPAHYSARYPRAVCADCQARVTDGAGRSVTGYNVSMSGGMVAYYTDSVGSAEGSQECVEVTRTGECFVDGVPAVMAEARFGGIVVQLGEPTPPR